MSCTGSVANKACDNDCSQNCSSNCYGDCSDSCVTSSGDPSGTKDEDNGEVNYDCNNAEMENRKAEGQLGCQGQANNTCGAGGGDNYCPNDCISGCSSCGAECGGSCGSSCTSCSGGCSGCSGSCSGSCSGCRGSCSGGCQGNCQGKCNKGCTNEEQENNAKVTLQRIVNVDNVKNIYKFIVYEARRRYLYDKKGREDWESKLNDKVALLNTITANYPTKYNNIIFTTTYTAEEKDETTGEIKTVTKSCEYIEKDITEPMEVIAYRDLYSDDNGNVHYGHSRAVINDNNGQKNEILYGDPQTFYLGTYHTGKDLENYFFDLNTDKKSVYRYKKSPEDKMFIQEYRYTTEKHEKYVSDKVFLLYYTIPKIFEETLKMTGKNPDIQSGTLEYDF